MPDSVIQPPRFSMMLTPEEHSFVLDLKAAYAKKRGRRFTSWILDAMREKNAREHLLDQPKKK